MNDADVYAHLLPDDKIRGLRHVPTARPSVAVPVTDALCRLGGVTDIAKLGAAGPLQAATTAGRPDEADPELRKFEALFARDALRVAQFIGRRFPQLRIATIESLAAEQGLEVNSRREEDVGKIPHEVRNADDPVARSISEHAGWGWPYYGAADTTPMFVVEALLMFRDVPSATTRQVRRRDGRSVSLLEVVSAAVTWLCSQVDADPDGLLAYHRTNPGGIANQTWRDSWDSLSHVDGEVVNHTRPVAAIDLQPLAYDALSLAADWAEDRALGGFAADELRERAARLRLSFLHSFFVSRPSGTVVAAALDFSPTGDRRAAATKISDVGHALHSRILSGSDSKGECRQVVAQLFRPEMMCSAGLRSLASDEIRFWPGGYHSGNSWIWQTIHIAAGLARCGFPHLSCELRSRALAVYRTTHLLPEFARGDNASQVSLNSRIVDVWQSRDQKLNRLEQPPQEIQAWTAASIFNLLDGPVEGPSSSDHDFEESLLAALRL